MARREKSLESLVLFHNSRGLDGRGTLLHVTRHSVAFEVYNPYSIVQLSEVLQDFRILLDGRSVYQGRTVVTHLVPTGALTIVSAALVDPWSDLSGLAGAEAVREEAQRFVQHWECSYRIRPDYQLAVSTLANFLQELSRWLGQAEALYADASTGLAHLPDELLHDQVQPPVEAKLGELFGIFEQEARQVAVGDVPVHKAFAQRELHPLLLCDPFLHRSFTKPLGYAGDYVMVNMILGQEDPQLSAYARLISRFNLATPPAVAHRNRIRILRTILRREARQRQAGGRVLRVLNVGCGPAAEVASFVATEDAADVCEFTLLDFNQETIAHAESRVRRAIEKHRRATRLRLVNRSIHDLLEGATSGTSTVHGSFDLVYCAGLFDYLSNRVCRRLVELFCDWVGPDGLVVVTNVHVGNPIRGYMEHVAEWHLEYRDERHLRRFAPGSLPSRVFTDPTNLNLFLEVRKPGA